MTRKPRTTFNTEFKREAVQLLERGNKDAAQFGINGVNQWGQTRLISHDDV